MGVLSTFTNVSALSLGANAAGCIAHGLPTTPDWANYQPVSPGDPSVGVYGGAGVCLVTRGASGLYFHNTGGSATPGEAVAQFCHALIR